ncbi:MAG TPA: STAS domain-containing protein [Candidatus Methylomirabilis sp.]|nr:STAS domain-containing protein [Candidatus Methylomirabilis sp.]
MAKHFRMVIYNWDGRITVELAGEIDGSSGAEVGYQLGRLGLPECTLDFSKVEAIDMFGAQVLARGFKSLRNRGVRFEIDGLPERVAEMLCLGGVLEAIV